MNWTRNSLLIAAAVPLMGLAQVAGPIEIGPSWGQAGANGQSAALFTTVINHGVLPDRLAGVTCPGYGQVAEQGVDPATEGPRSQDKGVLVPQGGRAVLGPYGARITLSDLPRPVHDGSLVPCTLHFVRTGERVIVFTIGAPGIAVNEP